MERKKLVKNKNYLHYNIDLRNQKKIFDLFKKYKHKITSIIHTAAQPSHDWAAKEPITDFNVNANATLNLLEAIEYFVQTSHLYLPLLTRYT